MEPQVGRPQIHRVVFISLNATASFFFDTAIHFELATITTPEQPISGRYLHLITAFYRLLPFDFN